MSRPIVCLCVLALSALLGAALPARATPPLTPEILSLPDVIAPLLPAVVNISVLKHDDSSGGDAGEQGHRPHRDQGSGFIVDADGYIVTNRHVVAGGDTVMVTLNDDRQFPAQVVSTNLFPDLALLKVDAGTPLPTVKFGNSNALRLGETVVAIGNPLGLSGSITVGVVSALNRNMNSTVIDDFIQTDAAINRGNSGGPLFNLRGEVVGVNWAIVSPTDTSGSIGLGLAIPANDAAVVVDQMRRYGRLTVGFPGLSLQAVTPLLSDALGLGGTEGGIVTQVWPDGPAAKAGIRAGDVVLQFGNERTRDVRALQRRLAFFPPGSVATAVVWRAGSLMTVQLVLAEFPPIYDPAGPPAMTERGPREVSPGLGLGLASLSEEARATYRLPPTQHGVVIEGVAANSTAADLGLARGDVIVRVQNDTVASPDDVAARLALARSQGRRNVLMLVRNQNQLQWMVIPLGGP